MSKTGNSRSANDTGTKGRRFRSVAFVIRWPFGGWSQVVAGRESSVNVLMEQVWVYLLL